MGKSHLFLTGYRGCGKSSVGLRLAQLMNRPWLDTDAMIEARYGQCIADLFASIGEAGFRDLEGQTIASLSELSSPHVISLGGGAILREANRVLLRQLGRVVWLKANPITLNARISSDQQTQQRRPKLSSLGNLEEIRAILEHRIPMYNEASEFAVETDSLSTEAVASAIFDWYQSQI